MPDFRYLLDYERSYHDLGLVRPGDVRTMRSAPDGNWKPVHHKTTAKKTADDQPAAPADGTPTASEE